jgi:hypothetical protein
MSHVAVPNTDADILATVIAPEEPGLDRAAAGWIMTLKFSAAQNARMEALADSSNEGTISDAERVELENYLRVGNLLNFLKAKARSSLGSAQR